MSKRIGFIGVGLMGHGMAKNLVAKGFSVTVLGHRNRAPVENLVSQGATEGTTPRALAEANDIVFLCVTGTPQVEGLIYGDDGILAGAHEGLAVVDTSTAEPDSTARIAADLAAKGAHMVDAPLARTPVEAEQGRLNTMVGASDAVFAAVRPALEAFCENIFHVGGVGAGHKMKLLNNFLAMGHAMLVAEAFCAGKAAGIDMRKFYDLVSAGGANSAIFQMIMPKALEGDLTGLQFALKNGRKDIRYYRTMTQSLGLTGSAGDAVHQALAQADNLGFGDKFVPSLIEAQEKLNDIKLVDR